MIRPGQPRARDAASQVGRRERQASGFGISLMTNEAPPAAKQRSSVLGVHRAGPQTAL